MNYAAVYGVMLNRAFMRSSMDTAREAAECANRSAMSQYMADHKPNPCRYCGRTNQTKNHKTCDGCGAPITLGGSIP